MQAPNPKKQKNTPAIILGIIAAALAVLLVLQNLSVIKPLINPAEQTRDVGHSTPEETAAAFADAIAKKDLDVAVSLFACNQMAENYDFAGMINRLQSWLSTMTMPYPSEGTLFTEINKEFQKNDVLKQIANVVFSLEGEEDYMNNSYVSSNEKNVNEIVSDMENACDPEELSTFEFVRMDVSNPELQLTEQNRTNQAKVSEIYGADDLMEYTVLYSYNGQLYAGGMTFICYEDDWYIYALFASLAGQSTYGYLTPTTEQEYSEMIENW